LAGTTASGEALHNRLDNHDIILMDDMTTRPRAKKCPICGKPAEQQFRPFCSKRCADVDLNRWLSGTYAVPVTEENEKPQADEPED